MRGQRTASVAGATAALAIVVAGATAALAIVALQGCGGGGSSSGPVSSSPPATPPAADSPPAANPPPASGQPPATPMGIDVATYKYDVARSGANTAEVILTPANVNKDNFGLLRVLPVDGKVDAQPLLASQLMISGVAHNVVYVATEHDSVYAFDADTGAAVWHVSLLGSGESLSDTHGCGQVSPEIGITSTPVMDRTAGTGGALYVVAMSKDASGGYYQRLHALDPATGAELFGGPVGISATYPAAGGGTTTFDPGQHAERAALLLSQGVLYTSWTSHCDNTPYGGWVIAYDPKTLARTAVLNLAPNSAERGPSIWMSGGGPAADAAGNVYLLTANGVFETTLDAKGYPSGQDYGNSFVRLASGAGTLSVADYFTMKNELAESSADRDLGSGGAMLLPDLTDAAGTVRHLMVGAGKDGNLYVVDRDSMGKFDPGANHIWQELDGVLPSGIWSTPAYLNGTVYYADAGGSLKAFAMTNAKLSATPTSQTLTTFGYPGTAPVASANGNVGGIIWAHENTDPAVLHAYDAADLAHELYNSNQAAGGRDHFGTGNKFVNPVVANGKVFVGTTAGVAVFGLLQ